MEARAMRAFDVSDPSRGSPVPSQSSRKWYVGAVCWAGFDSTRAEVEIQIPLRGGICGRRGRRQFGEFGGVGPNKSRLPRSKYENNDPQNKESSPCAPLQGGT